MQFHVTNMTRGGCACGVTKAIQSVEAHVRIKIDFHIELVDLRTAKAVTAFVPAL